MVVGECLLAAGNVYSLNAAAGPIIGATPRVRIALSGGNLFQRQMGSLLATCMRTASAIDTEVPARACGRSSRTNIRPSQLLAIVE